jgi:hypothetical protein
MNRMAPLIVRRVEPDTVSLAREASAGAAPAAWLDDLKLFATGWIGGLVFFGTFLG